MNPAYAAILLNILLFILFVLVPLIPAILIYKIFPETTVGANGFLGNLKINATGAFAAYLIVAMIGYFLVRNAQQLITSSEADNTSWVVKSNVVFLDETSNGWEKSKKINDDSIKLKLDIRSTPDYSQKNSTEVIFMTYYKDGLSRVSFAYPGYESQIKDINRDSVVFDYTKRTISLGKIELKQIKQAYNPNAFIQANHTDTFNQVPVFEPPKK